MLQAARIPARERGRYHRPLDEDFQETPDSAFAPSFTPLLKNAAGGAAPRTLGPTEAKRRHANDSGAPGSRLREGDSSLRPPQHHYFRTPHRTSLYRPRVSPRQLAFYRPQPRSRRVGNRPATTPGSRPGYPRFALVNFSSVPAACATSLILSPCSGNGPKPGIVVGLVKSH